MRIKLIMTQLLSSDYPVSIERLAQACDVSKRTIQSELKYLSGIATKHGFILETIRGKGYLLGITDDFALNRFLDLDLVGNTASHPEVRLLQMMFLLLDTPGYLTSTKLATECQISPSTVRKDLKKIEDIIGSYELEIENKPYFGTLIKGKEHQKRKLLIDLLYQEREQMTSQTVYEDVIKKGTFSFNYAIIQKESLADNRLFNEDSLDRLALYLAIGKHRHQVSNGELDVIEEAQLKPLCEKILISAWPSCSNKEEEIHLLMNEMRDVGSFEKNQERQEKQIIGRIKRSLAQVDQKFSTTFNEDQELVMSLKNHLLPLIERVISENQLENPLIDDVYARYADAFSVSLYFIEVFNAMTNHQITADEVAYLSLYFAGSIEKQKNQNLKRYRRVLIVCTSGGGAAYLLKMKLESIFIGAEIETTSVVNLEQIDQRDYDIILSTMMFDLEHAAIPVIKLTNFLDDVEQEQLKRYIKTGTFDKGFTSMNDFSLLDLFKPDCFEIVEADDYLGLLESRAKRLSVLGYANADYPANVLKRELSMTTIYGQGIAGPHGIEMGAIKECLDVIILKQSLIYQDKKVKLIFLINLDKGHLHLHKQISRLIMTLMSDSTARKRVEAATDFDDFIKKIKNTL